MPKYFLSRFKLEVFYFNNLLFELLTNFKLNDEKLMTYFCFKFLNKNQSL